MNIRYYTIEEFVRVFIDAAQFLYEQLESDHLMDKYYEFVISNNDIEDDVMYLKAALTELQKDWETIEYGVQEYESGMSLSGAA